MNMEYQNQTNMSHHHFLLISLTAQGHINPIFQLANILTRAGARATFATFATTVNGLKKMKAANTTIKGLSFASFSDGCDDEDSTKNFGNYMDQLKQFGSQNLAKLLQNLASDGRPVTCLIYTFLLPWAAEVAREMHVPSAFLAIQCATAFAIYHRFFNSRDGLYDGNYNDTINPTISIELPGLPLFTSKDLPTYLLSTDPYYSSLISIFQEHIINLERNPNPCVLINTFDALEQDSLKATENMNVIAIGPLVPSAEDKSFACDLFQSSTDCNYLQWLDSKPDYSVIYVSFGSLAVLQRRQKEEILQGLVETGRPFLWVIRDPEEDEVNGSSKEGMMMIVPWCSQVEVLSHRSIGCFVSHCGWNSTLESLVAGVPVVGFSQFSDQIMNAKLVEEVWGTGVRAVVNEEGIREREEIKRCVEMIMGGGERGEEIRKNTIKWKDLAMEAVSEGCNNLKLFLESLG